jgi:hypothetical protein
MLPGLSPPADGSAEDESPALDRRRSSSDEFCGVQWSRDMTERDPVLERFDALTGTWATEATHPLVDEVVPGKTRRSR